MAGIKNKKSLGQHWLHDRFILDEIAEFAAHGSNDAGATAPHCVEIGPGLGTLTSSLFRQFPEVIAVELDHRLAGNLPGSFPGKQLQVVEQSFLDFNLASVPAPYAIAGNIPYYITSPIITKILTAENPPLRAALLIQKEVAERIAAPHRSYFALFVQNVADVTLGSVVPRELFTPPPKVDSQVILLEPHAPLISPDALQLAKLGFSAPRKKLCVNLVAANLGLDKTAARQKLLEAGISADARPADVEPVAWERLLALLPHKS